jgi:hypothetical protein
MHRIGGSSRNVVLVIGGGQRGLTFSARGFAGAHLEDSLPSDDEQRAHRWEVADPAQETN